MIVQKLKKASEDSYQLAERYYGILSSLNSLSLTSREIQLMAFTAIHGNISYAHIKEEFCVKYNTSVQTIYNIVSKLVKTKVLVKDNGKIKVNPIIALKFNNSIEMNITLILNG
jgi:hypothetical protein